MTRDGRNSRVMHKSIMYYRSAGAATPSSSSSPFPLLHLPSAPMYSPVVMVDVIPGPTVSGALVPVLSEGGPS